MNSLITTNKFRRLSRVNEIERWANLAQIPVQHDNADAFKLALQDESELVRKLAHTRLGELGALSTASLKPGNEDFLVTDYLSGYHGNFRGFLWQVDQIVRELRSLEVEQKSGGLPQADDFGRLTSLVMTVSELEPCGLKGLGLTWELSSRQLKYYLDAALWLGLIKSESGRYETTARWSFLSQFNGFLLLGAISGLLQVAPIPVLENSKFEVGDEPIEGLSNRFSEVTLQRRLSTLNSWAAWLHKHLESIRKASSSEYELSSGTVEWIRDAESAIGRLPKRDFQTFSRWRFSALGMSKVTLEAVGAKLELTRERVRQISKQSAERVRSEIELDLDILLNQVEFDICAKPWINIFELIPLDVGPSQQGFFAIKCALEQLGFIIDDQTWPFGLKPEASEVVADFVRTRLPMRFSDYCESPIFNRVGIAEFVEVARIVNSRVILSNGLLLAEETARIDLANWVLRQRGASTIEDLGSMAGEANLKAYAEFLRRTPGIALDPLSHLYTLVDDSGAIRRRDPKDLIEEFLENFGPASGSQIFDAIAPHHPVGRTRFTQYLDDERFGHVGRKFDLVRKGAKRKKTKVPEVPRNVIAEDEKVTVLSVVTEDMYRGSGFALPRWFGWRLGLIASPQYFEFRQIGDPNVVLRITRRGGGIWSSSIRPALVHAGARTGCHITIYLNIDSQQWRISHDCSHSPKIDGN